MMNIKIDVVKQGKSLSRDHFGQEGYRITKSQVQRLIKKYNRRVKHKNKITE